MNTDTLLQAISERDKALQDYKALQAKNLNILKVKLQEYRDAIKPLLDQIPDNTISFHDSSPWADANVSIDFGYDDQISIVWENDDFKYNKRVVKYGWDSGGDNGGAYYSSEVISEKEFNDLFIEWTRETIRIKKNIDVNRERRNAENATKQSNAENATNETVVFTPPVKKSLWQYVKDLFKPEY